MMDKETLAATIRNALIDEPDLRHWQLVDSDLRRRILVAVDVILPLVEASQDEHWLRGWNQRGQRDKASIEALGRKGEPRMWRDGWRAGRDAALAAISAHDKNDGSIIVTGVILHGDDEG